MSEEQVLLKAISDQPRDDVPRLAYAEWLGEHGQPERADFIRLQCEVAAHDLPKYHESNLRAGTLLFEHWEEWTAPLTAIGMVTRLHFMPDDSYAEFVHFRRGFVEALILTAEHFVLLADRFAEAAPLVESLALRNTLGAMRQRAEGFDPSEGFRPWQGFQDPAALMQRLSWLPRLFRLSHLDLSTFGLTAEALEHLDECPLLSGLTHIELFGNRLGDDGARVVAGCDRWCQLQEISLDRNGITDDGAAALVDSPFPELTRLSLTGNDITEAGVARLRARFGDRVEF